MSKNNHVIELLNSLKQVIRTLFPTILYNRKFLAKINNLEEAIKKQTDSIDINSLIDHDLLIIQIKVLEQLQGFLDNIGNKDIVISGINEIVFNSTMKTIHASSSELEGVMNLLGGLHDIYHKVNKNDC